MQGSLFIDLPYLCPPQILMSALTQLSVVLSPSAQTHRGLSNVRARVAGHRLNGRRNPERPAMFV